MQASPYSGGGINQLGVEGGSTNPYIFSSNTPNNYKSEGLYMTANIKSPQANLETPPS